MKRRKKDLGMTTGGKVAVGLVVGGAVAAVFVVRKLVLTRETLGRLGQFGVVKDTIRGSCGGTCDTGCGPI